LTTEEQTQPIKIRINVSDGGGRRRPAAAAAAAAAD
jgi:hypothetical protein